MKKDIRLIALDLDGTLLDSNKNLSDENFLALRDAAEQGVEIVPTTGRFFGLMPEMVRSLPFLHYAITINGAAVFDVGQNRILSAAEISVPQAVEIMSYLDGFDLIYDCYAGNTGFMTAALQARVDEFTQDPHYRRMLKEFRKPVSELKAFISENGQGIQKIQMFSKDLELRKHLLEELPRRFPGITASSAFFNNIELNERHANKGEALYRLADFLGIPREATMACGDMLNDLSMIEAAGTGIAMGNAAPEVKAAADYVTGDCDHSGIAQAVRHFILDES